MKKLLFGLLFIATTISMAQESVLLRLNYEKGANYSMQMDMSQNMGGGAMMMNMGMNMYVKVIDVVDGIAQTESGFKRMTMDMSQGGMQMSYDSNKKDDELDDAGKMMKAQMGPMMKVKVFAKTDKFGKVTDTRVEPTIPNADQFNQSNNIEYPKNAVKVGDTWNVKKDDKGMQMDISYKVLSIDKTKVVLEATGKISGNATGTMKGKFDIERMSGIPLNSTIDMDMTVQGQKMKSTIKATMKKA